MTKRIMLTMAEELFKALEDKRKEQGYMTVQEIINDIVRKSLFAPAAKKSKAGRPMKIDDPYLEYFSRKR